MPKKKGGGKNWKKLPVGFTEEKPSTTEARMGQGADNTASNKSANLERPEANASIQRQKEAVNKTDLGAYGGRAPAHQFQRTYSNQRGNENIPKTQGQKETWKMKDSKELGARGSTGPTDQFQHAYSNVRENKYIPKTQGQKETWKARDSKEHGACGSTGPTHLFQHAYSNVRENKYHARTDNYKEVRNETRFNTHDSRKHISANVPEPGGAISGDSAQCLSKLRPPPSPGTVGRKINLVANVFDLQFKRERVYHYDVDVSECQTGKRGFQQKKSKVSKEKCKDAFAAFVKELRKQKGMEKFDPIYDGNKNLYTASKLPRDYSNPISIEIDGIRKTFVVTIKPVKKADGTNIINMQALKNPETYSLNEMNEIVTALNAILNYRDADCNQIKVGRSFFSYSEKVSIGDGLEILKGYNQSVHLTEKGPAMVLNLSAKVFHKPGPVIEYINEILRRDIRLSKRPLSYSDMKKIEGALKGVRVYATHSPFKRKYYIDRVSAEPAQNLQINVDGNWITVAEFFAKNYGRLNFPYLNCFQMRGSVKNKPYIPFENCVVLEAQPKNYDEKLCTRVASIMIKETAVLPKERFEKIEGYAKLANTEHMKNFDLNVYSVPKSVEGRVLEPPVLLLAGDKTAIPQSNGSWWMEGKFLRPIKNKSWIILKFGDGYSKQTHLENFAKALIDTSSSLGLILGEFKGIKHIRNSTPVSTALGEAEVKSSSLVVAVLTDPKSNTYNEIKFVADYNLQLVTQCVQEDAVLKLSPKTISNICLKLNVKLGGVNHGLLLKGAPEILKKKCIILGADVVHSTMSPSIAAVVGTVDNEVSKYQVSCRVQENKNKDRKSQELILDLEKMVKTIFTAFLTHNNPDSNQSTKFLPETIVYFRDGVSEGQFNAVQQWEMAAIRAASKKVFGREIPVTFFIVQKRHQIRLRPENPKEGIGAGKNIPANTKVDTVITYPNLFDFFICSHEGIRGTSKPTRYTLLQDDNKLEPNTIHALALCMCYLCFTCTKSISIPAPVKYADHAAYRAKNYVDFHMKQDRRQPYRYTGLPTYVCDAINNMEHSKNHLFYV